MEGYGFIDRNHDQNLVVVLLADLPHVITVSATGPLGWVHDPTTNLDVPADYTNYGQSAIDFAVPGGNVDFDLLNSGEELHRQLPSRVMLRSGAEEASLRRTAGRTRATGRAGRAGRAGDAAPAGGVGARADCRDGGAGPA